uniref:Uncharacterized protein n=1 Tax=Globodera rostochiensis TaxID=31243 RepID=A0A914H7B6_GLORO
MGEVRRRRQKILQKSTSAGVGRTGALVSIDYVLNQMLDLGIADVFRSSPKCVSSEIWWSSQWASTCSSAKHLRSFNCSETQT